MDILIAVASRHGSTREIGEAIAQELRSAGHEIDVRDAEHAPPPELYDAAIIGSAVYMGGWLASAREFVMHNKDHLGTIPIWLWSSGPLGDDTSKPTTINHLQELMEATGAREHRVFVGKLDPSSLGVGERLIARAVGAPEGDFRDWDAIRSWAREIAVTLERPVAET